MQRQHCHSHQKQSVYSEICIFGDDHEVFDDYDFKRVAFKERLIGDQFDN